MLALFIVIVISPVYNLGRKVAACRGTPGLLIDIH
jgi:hypothetical protein